MIGIRLLLKSSGGATDYVTPGESTHPAMRKTSIRELMVFLQATGLRECPPTLSTDAALRTLRRGGQSAVVAARFEGTAGKAKAAPKPDLAQKAAVEVHGQRALPFLSGANLGIQLVQGARAGPV